MPHEKFVPHRPAWKLLLDHLPISSGEQFAAVYDLPALLVAVRPGGRRKGLGDQRQARVMPLPCWREIAGDVYTIERIGELAAQANENLANAGYHHVHVRHADGTQGWAEQAPFDAISFIPGAPSMPTLPVG